jgi:hypothetical protein
MLKDFVGLAWLRGAKAEVTGKSRIGSPEPSNDYPAICSVRKLNGVWARRPRWTRLAAKPIRQMNGMVSRIGPDTPGPAGDRYETSRY